MGLRLNLNGPEDPRSVFHVTNGLIPIALDVLSAEIKEIAAVADSWVKVALESHSLQMLSDVGTSLTNLVGIIEVIELVGSTSGAGLSTMKAVSGVYEDGFTAEVINDCRKATVSLSGVVRNMANSALFLEVCEVVAFGAISPMLELVVSAGDLYYGGNTLISKGVKLIDDGLFVAGRTALETKRQDKRIAQIVQQAIGIFFSVVLIASTVSGIALSGLAFASLLSAYVVAKIVAKVVKLDYQMEKARTVQPNAAQV
ncbi:MAG: hypothetical protein S4CHLAM102_13200 [Chlamydiia bacterium]|nr:hypothetical protein [Chlamydiia bacterium]